MAACCIAAASYKPAGLLETSCRFCATPATTSYLMATTPLCRPARAAAGMALAGNDSPGGNFAAKHSGELNGRLDRSTGCGAAVLLIFGPAHAAKKSPTVVIRSVFAVFIWREDETGSF